MPTVAEVKAAAAKKSGSKKATPAPAPEEPQEAAVQEALPRRSGGRTTLADTDEFVNELYYGDGGSGKTTDLASMANLGPIVMINAESGIKRRPLVQLGINADNIQLVPDVGEPLTYQLLEDLFFELRTEVENGSIVGVAWDSLTEIHKVLLRDVVDKRIDKAERTGKGDTDPFFTDRSDYGVMTEQLRMLIRRYRDLPCHFAASALERRDIDDDGVVTYRPALTPALQTDVYGYMDVVCHTTVEEIDDDDERDLFTGIFRPAGKYRAKDRFGAMPHRMVDPTFQRVVAYVNDELEVDTDPVQLEARKRLEAAKAGADKS